MRGSSTVFSFRKVRSYCVFPFYPAFSLQRSIICISSCHHPHLLKQQILRHHMVHHYLPEHYPRVKHCLVFLLHYYKSCDGIMNIKNLKTTYSSGTKMVSKLYQTAEWNSVWKLKMLLREHGEMLIMKSKGKEHNIKVYTCCDHT